MASESSKLKRLMQIASLLKRTNELDVDMLAVNLEESGFTCSKRTLHRDISVLKSDFNAPIRYSKSSHAYILDNSSGWNMESTVNNFHSCSTTPLDMSQSQSQLYSAPLLEACDPQTAYGVTTSIRHSGVIVRCSKSVWQSSFDYLIPVEVKRLNKVLEDTVEVELDAVDEQKFIHWLFQYPSDITVLAPLSLKEKINAACTAIIGDK